MRRLFLFVLAINAIYFIWQLSMHDESEGMIGSTVENIKPIFLLSERGQPQIAEGSVSENLVAENLVAENLVAERGGAERRAAKDKNKQSELLGKERSETVLHSADEEMQGNIDGEKSGKIEKQAESEFSEIEMAPKNTCFTVGPFNDLKALRTLIDDIKNNVTDTKVRDQEEKELSVYWVYINPEKSRKDAKILGQNLKAKKIKDFYIIRSGEKNNGISLGHFKSKYRATKLTKRIKNLGFDVKIEPVFKVYTVYWLNYKMADNQNMPSNIFDDYEKFSVNNKITRLRRDCVAK